MSERSRVGDRLRSERLCEISGCDRPHYAFGWCRAHYDRWRQAGDPLAADRRTSFDVFSENFWERVDRSGGASACWPWMGGRTSHGYGAITRVADGRRRTYVAHRVAYELHAGGIPEGQEVCHSCDNPPCCNPAHLFLETHAGNMADMRAKQRGGSGNQPGERNNFAKLTADQVAEIRRRYPGETQRALAVEFGIHRTQVSRIVNGKRWSG